MAKVKKAAKLSPEERLMQATEGELQTEATMQLLMPPKVFAGLAELVRVLLQGGRHMDRNLVAQLALQMRTDSRLRFGHDSVETFALVKLMGEDRQRWSPKLPRVDAVTHIQHSPHLPHRLNTEQEDAADSIIEVWAAYGKFLEMSGRGIGGGGGNRSSALNPVDVMGQPTWDHHRDVYSPWHFAASRTIVERRTSNGEHLTLASVVFKILVEDTYPHELDKAFALVGGTALKALKWGLTHYHNPAKVAEWGKKPPVETPVAPKEGGLGAQTAAGGTGTPAKRPPGLWVAPTPKLAPGEKVKLAPRKAKTGT